MSNKSGISQYIDLSERTNEDRLNEFVRTIDFALDSVERGKYGVYVFTDIVFVACNRINDLFDANELFEIRPSQGDCVRTSLYIPKAEDVCYSLFMKNVKESNERYKNQEMDVKDFYIDLVLAKENLCENLQPSGYVLMKKNQHY